MYPWGRKFYWKVEDSVGKEPYWSECWKAHLITGFWFLLHLSMYVMLVVCTWSVIVFTRCWRRSFADLWYLLLWVGFSKKDVRKWIEIYMRYSTGLQECPRLALAFSGVRFKVSWASGDSETSSPPELVASFLHAAMHEQQQAFLTANCSPKPPRITRLFLHRYQRPCHASWWPHPK